MESHYGEETVDELEQDVHKAKGKIDNLYNKGLDKLEKKLNDMQSDSSKNDSENNSEDNSKNNQKEEPDSNSKDDSKSDSKDNSKDKEPSQKSKENDSNKEKNTKDKEPSKTPDEKNAQETHKSSDVKSPKNNTESTPPKKNNPFDQAKNAGKNIKDKAKNAGKKIKETGNEIKKVGKEIGSEAKATAGALKEGNIKEAGQHLGKAAMAAPKAEMNALKKGIGKAADKAGGAGNLAGGAVDAIGNAAKNAGRMNNNNASGQVVNGMTDAAVDATKTAVKAGIAAARIAASGGADIGAWIQLLKSGIVKYIVIGALLILALPIIVLVVLPGALLAMAWAKICEAFTALCESLNPTVYESFSMEDQYEILAKAFGDEVLRAYGDMKDTVHAEIDAQVTGVENEWLTIINNNKAKLSGFDHLYTEPEAELMHSPIHKPYIGMPTQENLTSIPVFIGGYTGDIEVWGDDDSQTNPYFNKGLLKCTDTSPEHKHINGCYATGHESYFDEQKSRDDIDSQVGYAAISDMAYLVSGYNVSMLEAPIIDMGSEVSALKAGKTIVKYKIDIATRIFTNDLQTNIDAQGGGFWGVLAGTFDTIITAAKDTLAQIFGAETSFFTFDGKYKVKSEWREREVLEYTEKLYHVKVPNYIYYWDLYYDCNGEICHHCDASHGYQEGYSKADLHCTTEEHTHVTSCYHSHTAPSGSCYSTTTYYTCGLSSSSVMCGQTAGESHSHTDSCYHEHSSSCRSRYLSCSLSITIPRCNKTPHSHDNSCYYWKCSGCECTEEGGHKISSVTNGTLYGEVFPYTRIKEAYTHTEQFNFSYYDAIYYKPTSTPSDVTSQIPDYATLVSSSYQSYQERTVDEFDLNRSEYKVVLKGYWYNYLKTEASAFDVDRILKAVFETSPYYYGYITYYYTDHDDVKVTTDDRIIAEHGGYVDAWKYVIGKQEYTMNGITNKVGTEGEDANGRPFIEQIEFGIDQQPYYQQNLTYSFPCNCDTTNVKTSDNCCPMCKQPAERTTELNDGTNAPGIGNRPITNLGILAVRNGYYFSMYTNNTLDADALKTIVGAEKSKTTKMLTTESKQSISDYVGDRTTHGAKEPMYANVELTDEYGKHYYPITVYDRVISVKNTSLKTLKNCEWIQLSMAENGLEFDYKRNELGEITSAKKINPLATYMSEVILSNYSTAYKDVYKISDPRDGIQIGIGRWQGDTAYYFLRELKELYNVPFNLKLSSLGITNHNEYFEHWSNNTTKMNSITKELLSNGKAEQIKKFEEDATNVLKTYKNKGITDTPTLTFLSIVAMHLDDDDNTSRLLFENLATNYKTKTLLEESLTVPYEETDVAQWFKHNEQYNIQLDTRFKKYYNTIINDATNGNVPEIPTDIIPSETLQNIANKATNIITTHQSNGNNLLVASALSSRKQNVDLFLTNLQKIDTYAEGQAIGDSLTFIRAMFAWFGYSDLPSTILDWNLQTTFKRVDNSNHLISGDIIVWSYMGNRCIELCVGNIDGMSEPKPETIYFNISTGAVGFHDWDIPSITYQGNKTIYRLSQSYE